MMDSYNKAVRAQLEAYKLDPENARAVLMKAFFSLLDTGTIDEELLEKSISIAPESFDVLYGVGSAYRLSLIHI